MPDKSSSDTRYCLPYPWLVGADGWLPTEGSEYGWADGVGCNRLLCEWCEQPVRSEPTESATRRYWCGCERHEEDGRSMLHPMATEASVRRLPNWRCEGHSVPAPSGVMETIVPAADADMRAVVCAAILVPPLPVLTVGLHPYLVRDRTLAGGESGTLSGTWLVRAFRLLPEGKVRERFGSAIVDCLNETDARLVRGALDFLTAEPEYADTHGAAERIEERMSVLRTLRDPRDGRVSLAYGAALMLASISAAQPGSTTMWQAAKSAALGGVGPGRLVNELIRREPEWVQEHLLALVRQSPVWTRAVTARSSAATVKAVASLTPVVYRALRRDLPEPRRGTAHLPATLRAAFKGAIMGFGANEARARVLLAVLAGSGDQGLGRSVWMAVAKAMTGSVFGPPDIAWLLREARHLVGAVAAEDGTRYRIRDPELVGYLRRQLAWPALLSAKTVPVKVSSDVFPAVSVARVRLMWASWRTRADWRTIGLRAAATCLAVGTLDGSPVLIVGLSKDTVQLIDLQTGEALVAPSSGIPPLAAVAWGEASGEPVIAGIGRDGQVRLWSVRSGVPLVSLSRDSHNFHVQCIGLGTVGGTSVLITGGADRTARIWNAATGAFIRIFEGHEGPVRAVAIAEGGRVAVTTTERRVRVWDADTGELRHVFSDQNIAATGIVGGRMLVATAGSDGRIRVVDAQDGELIATFDGRPYSVAALAVVDVGGDPVVAVERRNKTVEFLEVRTGRLQRVLGGDGLGSGCLAVATVDGTPVLVTAHNDSVALWRLEPPLPAVVPASHAAAVTQAVMAEVGEWRAIVTTGDDDTVRVWDADTGRLLQSIALGYHHGEPTSLAFAVVAGVPLAALSTATGEWCTIPIWSANPLPRWSPDGAAAARVTVGAADGDWVVAVAYDDHTVGLWHEQASTVAPRLQCGQGEVTGVTTGTAGGRLVVITAGTDGTVRVWDAVTGSLRRTLTGHTGPVRAVTFGLIDETEIVASSGDDGTVRVWDAGSGVCQTILETRTGAVTALALASGRGVGTFIAAACGDDVVTIWEFESGGQITTIPMATDVVALAGSRTEASFVVVGAAGLAAIICE